MPSNFIGDIQVGVVGAATFDIQPPPGQAYKITEISSDVAFVGDVPDVSVALNDGVHAAAVIIIDPTTAVQKGARAKEIIISNANYLTVTNTAAGAANIGWCGIRVNVNNVRTDVVTVPNAADYDIRPPLGEVWRITEIGAETMGANNRPDMTFFITDGVLVASAIMDETHNLKQDKLLDWYVGNGIWVRATDLSGADNDLGFCAERVAVEHFADVQDVAGSGTMDIQPAAGQQVIITEISAETWAGIAPVGSPDITVSFFDGANLSDIMEPGSVSDSLSSTRTIALMIDNAHYLRITEISTANNEVGYLGYVFREFTD